MRKNRKRIKTYTPVRRNKSIKDLEAEIKALDEMYRNVSVDDLVK